MFGILEELVDKQAIRIATAFQAELVSAIFFVSPL